MPRVNIYNKLAETTVEQSPSMYCVLSFQENPTNETFGINIRQFKNTASYQGPTKNGLAIRIEDSYDVERWQNAFNEIFEEAKKIMKGKEEQ